jgi:hypothetical protein
MAFERAVPSFSEINPPGGYLMSSSNALSKQALDNLHQQLENQYYAPNIQSEIGYRNALTQGQNIENQYSPDRLRLANAISEIKRQYEAQNQQATINSLNATTNKINTMTPLEAKELTIKNKLLPQTLQADINYKNMGGGRGSTGSKDALNYQYQVGLDNPQLSDDQIREAANVYANGGDTLSDGTKLNPQSPLTKQAYDRAYKSTTSAKLVTAGVQANQADAELTALNNHVAPVIKDVGTTYFNRSPDQILASLGSDSASQKKVGRIIGARSLQYAIAQLRNRIDMGEPGINATKELMDNSGQLIDVVAPRLTGEARQAAQDFINEGVRKALEARNKYGVGASGASGKNSTTSNKSTVKPTLRYNQSTGEFEEI